MKMWILTIFVVWATTIFAGFVDACASDRVTGPPTPDYFSIISGDRGTGISIADMLDQGKTGSYSTRAGAKASAGFGLRSLHRYLGYGTLLLAGMTAVTSSEKSVHYACAWSATGTAVATCATGFIKYNKRFNPGRGLLKDDNLHIILGVAGTIGLATAALMADSGNEAGHSGIGGAGAVSMMISVVVIKW